MIHLNIELVHAFCFSLVSIIRGKKTQPRSDENKNKNKHAGSDITKNIRCNVKQMFNWNQQRLFSYICIVMFHQQTIALVDGRVL